VPEYAAMIAVLIVDRPLCVKCISDKSGLTANQIESYISTVCGVPSRLSMVSTSAVDAANLPTSTRSCA
jgi:hypothetical protein